MSIEDRGNRSGSPEVGETISHSSKAADRIVYPDRAFELARRLEASDVLSEMENGESAKISASVLPASNNTLNTGDCVAVFKKQGADALVEFVTWAAEMTELRTLVERTVRTHREVQLARKTIQRAYFNSDST